jgi:hypothetical protein
MVFLNNLLLNVCLLEKRVQMVETRHALVLIEHRLILISKANSWRSSIHLSEEASIVLISLGLLRQIEKTHLLLRACFRFNWAWTILTRRFFAWSTSWTWAFFLLIRWVFLLYFIIWNMTNSEHGWVSLIIAIINRIAVLRVSKHGTSGRFRIRILSLLIHVVVCKDWATVDFICYDCRTERCFMLTKFWCRQVWAKRAVIDQILWVKSEHWMALILLIFRLNVHIIIKPEPLLEWNVKIRGWDVWNLIAILILQISYLLIWSKAGLFCHHSPRVRIVVNTLVDIRLLLWLLLQAVLVNLEIWMNDTALRTSCSVSFSCIWAKSCVIFRNILLLVFLIQIIVWTAKSSSFLVTDHV